MSKVSVLCDDMIKKIDSVSGLSGKNVTDLLIFLNFHVNRIINEINYLDLVGDDFE